MPIKKFFAKKLKIFKRRKKAQPFSITLLSVLLISGLVAYAGYMGNQRLRVNPDSYTDLLNLIGRVESNNNYNAYFGNTYNASVEFTDMPISDVLEWQKNHVAKGSPSSAVGRYQILNTTLESLVKELDIEPTQTFDEPMQDKMAVALVERRGAEQYINKEISKEEFAANLAKEWAALPKVIGENPEQSYYADDGLNNARAAKDDVLNAIKPISAE